MYVNVMHKLSSDADLDPYYFAESLFVPIGLFDFVNTSFPPGRTYYPRPCAAVQMKI